MSRVPKSLWPPEWDVKTLGEICTMQIGRTPKRSNEVYWTNGVHTWVTIADLSSRIVTSSKEHVTDKAIEDNRVILVPEDSLLMSFKLTIGKLAFAGKDLFTNEAIVALNIKPEYSDYLDIEYLYWALHAVPLDVESTFAVKGHTLNSDKLSRIELPIPVKTEQRRIVARIEMLLEEVGEIRRLQEGMAADADKLMDAAVADVFASRNGQAAQWDWVALGDVGTNIGGGTPRKSVPEYWNGTIPWVSPKDMKTKYIAESQDYVTELGIEQSSAKTVPPGSLLIVFRSGILAHSLPVAIATREVAINQDMKAILLDPAYDSEYMGYAIQSVTRAILRNNVKKGPTVHSLVGERFWSTQVPIPTGPDSLTKQKQIVSHLNMIQNEVIEMQETNKSDEELVAELEQAILSQAFRGEL